VDDGYCHRYGCKYGSGVLARQLHCAASLHGLSLPLRLRLCLAIFSDCIKNLMYVCCQWISALEMQVEVTKEDLRHHHHLGTL